MMAGIVESPRTDYGETHIAEGMSFAAPEFSEVQSFASPSKGPGGRQDIVSQMRSQRGIHSTPVQQRIPLAQLRQPRRAEEFTPLLKSATKRAALAEHLGDHDTTPRFRVPGEAITPAAMKPGFKLGNTPLPEPSEMYSSSSLVNQSTGTPLPPAASSSMMSTPLALPRRGEEGFGDGGNVLTLREQEAKLEQIDKENFGLKLKIHYLEENLTRNGPEHYQIMSKENVELKKSSAEMQLNLRTYRKSMKQAEYELEQYRQQLREYAEKVKRRHMDDAIREEMDELRRINEERAVELDELREKLDNAQSDDRQAEKYRDDIGDLEAELREKESLLDQKEDEVEALEAKLRVASGEADAEVEEKDRRIAEQEEHIAALKDDLQRLERERDNEGEEVQSRLDKQLQAKNAELEELKQRLHTSDEEALRKQADLEEQLKSLDREKQLEIRALQRQAQSMEHSKQDDIDSLMDRIRLAESQGDNQVQLVQQAANDSREQARKALREKDSQIESLTVRLDAAESQLEELEEVRNQLRELNEKQQQAGANEAASRELTQTVQIKLDAREKEIESLKKFSEERNAAIEEVQRLQQRLSQRDQELTTIRKAVSTQETTIEEMKQLQFMVNERTRELENARKSLQERNSELEALRQHADEPDSQLEAVQNIVRDRDNELEDLRDDLSRKDRELDDAKDTAAERLETIRELQVELETAKQDLEDEIQVLVDDAEDTKQERKELREKVILLEKELEESHNIQVKVTELEKEIRTAEREKTALQTKVSTLESEVKIADQDRESLQSRIVKLDTSRQTGNEKVLTEERRKLQEIVKNAKLEAEELSLRVTEKETELVKLEGKLRSELREKDKQLRKAANETDNLKFQISSKEDEIETLETRLQQAEATSGRSPRTTSEINKLQIRIRDMSDELNVLQEELAEREQQVQSLTVELRNATKETTTRLRSIKIDHDTAVEDGLRLREEIMSMEKRHQSELRGLARQIGYLRKRCEREESFREGLGWQKRWFLLTVGMYGICNKASLNLVAEMGITPDASFHDRRPTLKAVGLGIIATIRMCKMRDDWAKSRKVHEGIVKKLESMRRGMGRRSLAA